MRKKSAPQEIFVSSSQGDESARRFRVGYVLLYDGKLPNLLRIRVKSFESRVFYKTIRDKRLQIDLSTCKRGNRNCISFPISLIIAKRRRKALVRIRSLVLNVILSLKFFVCMILNFFPMEWIYLGLKKHLTIESKDNCKRSFNSVCLQPRCEIIYSHTEFDCL